MTTQRSDTASSFESDAAASFRFPGANAERRADKRFGLQRPGKVFRRQTQTYTPVTTRDLSLGGALVEVESDWAGRGFTVGEIVDVGVSYTGRAVVRTGALTPAVVVRVRALDGGRQAVALRYLEAAAQARAA